MKKDKRIKDRRIFVDRRIFDYTEFYPERRKGERRKNENFKK
jgi:hypothetical protein